MKNERKSNAAREFSVYKRGETLHDNRKGNRGSLRSRGSARKETLHRAQAARRERGWKEMQNTQSENYYVKEKRKEGNIYLS